MHKTRRHLAGKRGVARGAKGGRGPLKGNNKFFAATGTKSRVLHCRCCCSCCCFCCCYCCCLFLTWLWPSHDDRLKMWLNNSWPKLVEEAGKRGSQIGSSRSSSSIITTGSISKQQQLKEKKKQLQQKVDPPAAKQRLTHVCLFVLPAAAAGIAARLPLESMLRFCQLCSEACSMQLLWHNI